MNFVSVPYLPNDVKTVIIDGRFREVGVELEKLDINVIYTKAAKNLPSPVAFHPDLQICHICDNHFVVAPDCYEYYCKYLLNFNAQITIGDMPLGVQYPQDTAYNIARVGSTALLNMNCTDSVVLGLLKHENVKIVHINQGYAKCSVCIVSQNAIITSDIGIARVAKECGIDCLVINQGNIELEGYGFGFIGGASGLINKNTLAFVGDVTSHPDYNSICKFCTTRGISIKTLGKGKLTDIGSIIPITERK